MRKKLYKSFEHTLHAHIYEHVIVRRIHEKMNSSGLLQFVDFTLRGYTEAGTAMLETELISPLAERSFDNLLLSQEAISKEECMRAAQECAIEYCRPIVSSKTDYDQLTELLNKFHSEAWVGQADFVNSAKGRGSFKAKFISYGDYSPRSNKLSIFEHRLDNDFCRDNQEILPLVTVLYSYIVLGVVPQLNEKYVSYDLGDDWSDSKPYISYQYALGRLKTSNDTSEQITTSFVSIVGRLTSKENLARFVQTLKDHYIQEEQFYFGDATMGGITGQIIGKKGLQRICTIENVEKLVRATTFSVLEGRTKTRLNIK